MKILNITAQKPDSTGSGVYLAELVDAFARAGHDAGVIAGVAAEDACEVPGASFVRPVRFETEQLPFAVAGMSDEMPYRSTRYRDLSSDQVRLFEGAFRGALDEALDSFRPDAVLCHHLYLLTALVRERVRGIPVAAICHSTDLRQMRSHGLARERIIAAIRDLDIVFSLHGAQREGILSCYGVDPARVQVVGTGFDSQVFRRERMHGGEGFLDALSTPPSSRALNLVYVGKIAQKKGVGCLLEALDLLAARASSSRPLCASPASCPPLGGDPECAMPSFGAPWARLVLVGGHGNAAEYDGLCARARACRYPVELAGRLSQGDLVRAYQKADVFVLPSFYEGLPLVVIEALACGCRVVVTDLPGIRPWLEERVPDAPVEFVAPPRMRGVDDPLPEDLPAFERRLADAIVRVARRPRCEADLDGLSWESLAARIAGALDEAAR